MITDIINTASIPPAYHAKKFNQFEDFVNKNTIHVN